jgi:hypothetical protein
MRVLAAYRGRAEPIRRLAAVAFALVAYAVLTAALYLGLRSDGGTPGVAVTIGTKPPTRNVSIRGEQFWVDGEPFFIKAVGWDPTRPGELPWTRPFDAEVVEEDFRRMRAAGFNTVRTWAPMRPEELALAARHDLRVLQGIWVDPDGAFADPDFRRRTLAEVARSVEASRYSPAVLGYLVLNEPRASAVAAAGLDETRAFLREVMATVRALDPSAPIGYASWPGLEALDDPLLDFVAFNLYPHRPRVVMDELGLVGYANMVRRTIAGGRPFVISEFGLSVSPGRPLRTPGRGGASPGEQADGLLHMASTFASAGVAGLSVFQWSDGWWKNDDEPGDELEHDPHDAEEWFGLVEFESVEDRHGQPRPALSALARHQRAVLLEPLAGVAEDSRIAIRLHATEEITVQLSIDGTQAKPIALTSSCSTCYEAMLDLGPGAGRRDLRFDIFDAHGEPIHSAHRLVHLRGVRPPEISIVPLASRVEPGATLSVLIDIGDRVGARGGITVASYSEDEFFEERAYLESEDGRRLEVTFQAPDRSTIMTLIVFENDPELPPAERAVAWAAVEVREAP